MGERSPPHRTLQLRGWPVTPLDYVPKTEPWKHQLEAFLKSADLRSFGYLHEQRCGKTKPCIDKTAYQFELGSIDALVVVALPSGVHRNWITDEIPAHLPDRIPRMCVAWDARRAGLKKVKGRWVPRNKTYAETLERLLAFPGLSVLTLNGEAVDTRGFDEYMKRFLKARRIHLVGDESTLLMKRMMNKMAVALRAYGRHPSVIFRTIMDGTPMGEGPFDLFPQFYFLDKSILGFDSGLAFRNHFGEWHRETNHDTGIEYPVLDDYKNLDELFNLIAPNSHRVTRAEAFPNMPAQVVTPLRFDLSDEQVRVYNRLAEEYEADLRNGRVVTAPQVLTRYMRLQQVASNFWPPEKVAQLCATCSGEGCESCDGLGAVMTKTDLLPIDPKKNSRLDVLRDQLTRTRDPFIVWARFTKDVDDCIELCDAMGIRAVRYDGMCSSDEKAASKLAFQQGTSDALVGKPTSGGRGLTLKRARTVYNYSGYYSLLVYLQGNDRGEDVTRDVAKGHLGTSIVNLIANGSIDEEIDEAHLRKERLADLVLRRPKDMFRRIE